jgi:hypothetical protein
MHHRSCPIRKPPGFQSARKRSSLRARVLGIRCAGPDSAFSVTICPSREGTLLSTAIGGGCRRSVSSFCRQISRLDGTNTMPSGSPGQPVGQPNGICFRIIISRLARVLTEPDRLPVTVSNCVGALRDCVRLAHAAGTGGMTPDRDGGGQSGNAECKAGASHLGCQRIRAETGMPGVGALADDSGATQPRTLTEPIPTASS